MPKGYTRATLVGDVSGTIAYAETNTGVPTVTFQVACDDFGARETVWVKVNAYGSRLVSSCRERLSKGARLFVDGGLMNRSGQYAQMLEVRARDLIFFPSRSHEKEGEERNG